MILRVLSDETKIFASYRHFKSTLYMYACMDNIQSVRVKVKPAKSESWLLKKRLKNILKMLYNLFSLQWIFVFVCFVVITHNHDRETARNLLALKSKLSRRRRVELMFLQRCASRCRWRHTVYNIFLINFTSSVWSKDLKQNILRYRPRVQSIIN